MNTFAYPARIVPAEEGGWLIGFRDFPEGISQGDDDEEAIYMAEGCLQACIEWRLEDGIEVPAPSAPRKGEILIAVPIETATKAALLMTVAASGTSQVALAKTVDLDEKEIRRMLDPKHSSKLPRIERVLRALGKELRLVIVDAVRVPTKRDAVVRDKAVKLKREQLAKQRRLLELKGTGGVHKKYSHKGARSGT